MLVYRRYEPNGKSLVHELCGWQESRDGSGDSPVLGLDWRYNAARLYANRPAILPKFGYTPQRFSDLVISDFVRVSGSPAPHNDDHGFLSGANLPLKAYGMSRRAPQTPGLI